MEVTRIMQKKEKTNNKILIGIYRKLAKFLGCYIGKNVSVGNNVLFVHNAIGTVIHSDTIIKDNVRIYQNVTLGQRNVYEQEREIKFVVCEGAILCAGAKVLCSDGTPTIGRNSVVGANAVLLHSIPDNEIWGGIPAKKIGEIK